MDPENEGLLWPDNECVNNINSSWRSYVNSGILILWMGMAAILLLNFIIAVMNNTFMAVEAEVGVWVKFSRMRICRANDRRLPSIPAPFQTVIWLMKQIWFYLFEPMVYVFTGSLVNETKLICSTQHIDAFYKREKALKSIEEDTFLRKPYFIRFKDHIHGETRETPRGFCARLQCLPMAMREAKSGKLPMSNDKEEDPPIWSCGYCRCTNFEFERQKDRDTLYSDIIRYYKYNDMLPPEFGFNDADIQFLEHIEPNLCSNCFRLRYWVERHEIIESMIAFWMYTFCTYIVCRLPLLLGFGCLVLILMTFVIIFGILAFILFIIWAICWCFVSCAKCCTNACTKMKNSVTKKCTACCTSPARGSRVSDVSDAGNSTGFDQITATERRGCCKWCGGPQINYSFDYEAERIKGNKASTEKQLFADLSILTEGGPGNGEMDDDHWDETNGNQDDYDDVNAHRIFELVLMMKSSDLSEEQEQNFKKILKGASDAMEPTNWKQRLAGKFLDVNQKMKEIQEGNQRIVLKKEEYIDCRKFKRNVYDQA